MSADELAVYERKIRPNLHGNLYIRLLPRIAPLSDATTSERKAGYEGRYRTVEIDERYSLLGS